MAKLQYRNCATPTMELAALIETDGAVVVENMIPAGVVEQLRRDVLQAAASIAEGTGNQGLAGGEQFAGPKTKRFSSLGHVSAAYYDLLDNEVYAALADAVLLPHCGSYWVNTGMAMLIGPGNPAQMLHRDSGNWTPYCEALWPQCPEITLSAMIALEPATEALGTTRVIPGSHRPGKFQMIGNPADSVPAEMPPGDALVYSGHVLHGGGANVTPDQWRVAVHLSFVAGWLTPEESSPLDYSDEQLQARSPRVQRLLGHRSYDPSPHAGGGLWLRQVQKIEEVNGYS